MVDQVNPMGSLAPSVALSLIPATKPVRTQGSPRAAKPADVEPQGSEASPAKEASAKDLEAAAKDIQSFISAQSDLMIKVDESSGRIYFKIVDSATKEVILQVPSEEVLAMARKLRELATLTGAAGVLVDKEG